MTEEHPDEVAFVDDEIVPLHWSGTIGRYVTIPVDDDDADELEHCPDCGLRVEWVDDQWRHVDPTASCFLYRARS